jgi:hypothetical protein
MAERTEAEVKLGQSGAAPEPLSRRLRHPQKMLDGETAAN